MLTKILRHFIAPLPSPSLAIRTKNRTHCQPDEILKKKAQELVLPYATALAGRLRVSWNPKLRTTAGLALYHSWEVVLNPKLKIISDAEVEKTLRHELAHLLARDRSGKKKIAPHGKEWRQACIDLGIPKEKATHQLPFVRTKQQRNFFYRCPACREILSRVRQPRCDIACLKCCRKHAGGRYDKRFRYEMIQ
ncbi:MAG: SprT-like domain-containing protein [Chthoniobacterales bacterium]